jgi:ATP-binding cassette subfamily B protein
MHSDPDLLILDEPSAGLDAVAESRVHATMRAHRAGRTSLLISHRLNTLRDADKIAVLADGQVVELGTHDELMTASGTYANMFALQAAGYQDDRVMAPSPRSFDLHEAVLKANGGPVRIMSMSSQLPLNSDG